MTKEMLARKFVTVTHTPLYLICFHQSHTFLFVEIQFTYCFHLREGFEFFNYILIFRSNFSRNIFKIKIWNICACVTRDLSFIHTIGKYLDMVTVGNLH